MKFDETKRRKDGTINYDLSAEMLITWIATVERRQAKMIKAVGDAKRQ